MVRDSSSLILIVVNNNAGFLCWPLALGPPLAVGKYKVVVLLRRGRVPMAVNEAVVRAGAGPVNVSSTEKNVWDVCYVCRQ